jgi:hypothetical protein
METASEAIQRKTGWSVVILAGGPEPQRAGGIRTLGYVSGYASQGIMDIDFAIRITKGSIPDTGKGFEEFCPVWNTVFNSFTEFCENVTRK